MTELTTHYFLLFLYLTTQIGDVVLAQGTAHSGSVLGPVLMHAYE